MTLGSRKDLFGPDGLDAVDRLRPKETAVGFNGVHGFALPDAPTGGHRLPVGRELGSGEASCPLLDCTGHDPLDVIPTGVFGLGDHDRSGVFDAERVDPVDGVGPREAAASATSGKIAGERTRVQHGAEECDRHNPYDRFGPHDGLGDVHGSDPTEPHPEAETDEGPNVTDEGPNVTDECPNVTDEGTYVGAAEQFVTPRWMKATVGVVLVLISAAIAFAVFEPIQVLPRLRLAPGYSLTDQSGGNLTSEDVRGSVTLYTFVSLDCVDECREIDETMRFVQEEVAAGIDLGDTNFRLVTIVLDENPTVAALDTVAARSGADGKRWTVVGGDAAELQNVVASGFGRFFSQDDNQASVRFDPGFVLVDGAGVIRGDYRYQTLADDGEKLVRHIDVLSSELKYADGSAALAYEAAHLFLCYP